MAAMSNNTRITSRRVLVEEHIRFENPHDLEGILSTFGLEARDDDEPRGDHRIGRDQVRRFYEELLKDTPDLHIELLHCHAADTAIVVEVMITGTRLGDWRGLPVTGRFLRFPLCGIYTFDQEDRLSGEKIYYDRATVLKQLGLFREPTHGLGRLLTLINHPLTIARALRWFTFQGKSLFSSKVLRSGQDGEPDRVQKANQLHFDIHALGRLKLFQAISKRVQPLCAHIHLNPIDHVPCGSARQAVLSHA